MRRVQASTHLGEVDTREARGEWGHQGPDTNPHTIALYLLSWDGQPRPQLVRVQTPSGSFLSGTPVVLGGTTPIGSKGLWLVYQVCGSVDFVVTYTGSQGVNAAVSGLFFGPPPSTHLATTATSN